MADEQPHNIGDHPVARFPQALTLKDLITIISVSVALAMAWGVFGTRIAVLENDIVTLKQTVTSNSGTVAEISKMVERVRDQQIQHDIFIDQLYELLQKAPPRRRGGTPPTPMP